MAGTRYLTGMNALRTLRACLSIRASTTPPLHARTSAAFTSVDECLRDFVNHEKSGVPRGAGTDTKDGFDLSRMRRLLADFKNPHMGYNTIHVSGTKGKGTTLSVLASVLRASGLQVGTYKSPHVYTVAERIRSSDDDSSSEVLRLLNELEPAIRMAQDREDGQLSYFEVLTALAFAYFERIKVDVALVEVGLGGIRDATNVLESRNLEAAVITHIGEEHIEALGGSIETIIEAKAGIAHKDRPVFFSRSLDERIHKLLKQSLVSRGANIDDAIQVDPRLVRYQVGANKLMQELDIDILVNGKIEAELRGVPVALVGPHQRENIGLALRVLWWLRSQNRINISVEDIKKGLESTRSPGNFELFETNGGPTLVADGAHTRGSAAVMVQTLREVYPNRNFIFVVAMADDKDHAGFLTELYRVNPISVICTQIEVAGGSLRTTPSRKLAQAYTVQSSQLGPLTEDKFDVALKKALIRADDAVVVVTGSLYTFKALQKALF